MRTIYNYKYNGKELQDELGLNTYAYGFRDYDPAIGRWFNIDQLSEKYHTSSPYAFVQNIPEDVVENDEIVITGNQKEATLDQLNKGSELTLTMDEKGKVKAEQNFVGPLTQADSEIMEASTDKSYTVSLNSTDGIKSTDGSGALLNGLGSFDGSKVGSDGSVTVNQTVNPNFGKTVDNFVERPEGVGVVHETLEAIQEGKRAASTGTGSDANGESASGTANYNSAHNKARAIDSRHTENYDYFPHYNQKTNVRTLVIERYSDRQTKPLYSFKTK